jgi:hypothetical protein
MRKFIWFSALAAVASLSGAIYYACENPHSVVGQLLHKAATVSNAVNPVMLATQLMADGTYPKAGQGCCKSQAEPAIDESLPAEPVPLEEPATQPDNQADANALWGPPQIVIREQDPREPPIGGVDGVVPSTDNGTDVFRDPVLPANELSEEKDPCPRIMPHAPKDGQTSETDQAPVSPEPGSDSDCHRYHERYQVCPYTGKCYEMPSPASGPEMIGAPNLDDPEEQEPAKEEAKPKVKKKTSYKLRERMQGNTFCPKLPEVDTMEYRRSDARLNEYSGGPY